MTRERLRFAYVRTVTDVTDPHYYRDTILAALDALSRVWDELDATSARGDERIAVATLREILAEPDEATSPDDTGASPA